MSLSIPQLRSLADQSFFHFVRLVNPAPPGMAPVSKSIHKSLCQFAQNESIKRKAIAMPRDWLKSTTFTKWRAIYKYLRNHEERILIAAENERIASRFVEWIESQLLNNSMLRRLYPELEEIDVLWIRSHKWASTECVLPRSGIYSEPSISAIGIGGAAQSGHFTSLLIDDLVGKKAQESVLVLESVERWFDNVNELLVQPDMSHPQASEISIVGTFWFPGDFFFYVQEKYPEYQWRIVPCRKDADLIDADTIKYVQDATVEAGESNWSEQFPTQYYVDMLANPEKNMIYWSQHMNAPHKSSGLTKIDESWIKWWHFEQRGDDRVIVCDDKEKDGTYEEFKVDDIPWWMVYDPGAFSDVKNLKSSSRNAVVVGGQPPGSIKKFVGYTWAGKQKEPEKIMDEIFKAYEEWKPRQLEVEVFAAQRYIFQDILQEAKERKKPVRAMPLEKDVAKDAKDHRIQGLIAPTFNGEIYLHRSMKDLKGEMISYPGGITRDLVDALGILNERHWQRHSRVDVDKLNARAKNKWELARETRAIY